MLRNARRAALSALLASAALSAPAFAQDVPATPAAAAEDSGDIVVTAQKREENLQDVPVSIQALGTRKLDQLNISNFAEFSQLLPSVAFQSQQPGVTTVYMRGVASGGDGNHSGSLPSVGVYLDEQPVTTIGGTLDVHVYDIARIESLAGPQGTLYGASSQAGTIRIITNKPELNNFSGRVDAEVNTVAHGGQGGKLEGMLNVPIADMAALRVVGFYQRDAGYIDNVAGTRSFNVSAPATPLAPGYTGTVTNAPFVKKDFNTTETFGGRAALKIDLDDTWTVTPGVIYQEQKTKGIFGYDKRVGDLQVQRFAPDYRRERFIQAALTIEGKIGNWDATYAGAYLDRTTHSGTDYTDYAEAYDALYSSVGGVAGYLYFQNAAGQTIDQRQYVVASDHFKKMSQEFRVASPQSERFRIVAGVFYQRQSNLIHQDYQVANLAPALSVNNSPGTLWLTQQHRVDRDYAVFGEASFDILPNLTFTAGGRAFIYDNTLIGFYGFGRNPAGPPYNAVGSSGTGVAACFTTTGATLRNNPGGTLLPAAVAGGPCTNLGVFNGSTVDPKQADGQGFTHKLNLTWKPKDGLLAYATWSRGFRPGGINRQGTLPPYDPDYLTNYEIGFKTTPIDHLRFNGAIYMQDWKAFQFSFLGLNSLTQIQNGSNARIKGVEADLNWTPDPSFSFTASGAYTDAKTRQNICNAADPTFSCTAAGNFVLAPKGTRLPITPKFKANATARYSVPLGTDFKAYVQGLVAYQGSASTDIRTAAAAVLGRLSAYTTGNLSIGAETSRYTFELFAQNITDERAELSRYQACSVCNQRNYTVVATPRTIGIRAGAKF
ncbi:TonB-dependent receptor [Sphingomonas sp. Leaf357]|uniref:TonB-dependent receptor n=1 Tax=Sphingomonas sp. Leaf357 TaxID=1736350 RepID=UPI0006F76CA6|nr:TonB-dependent receptor [Sphingomonas sp. Leaf357]KQS02328.1 TonB-dependent receptor [Sphingomonas sp. Leaf357]